MTEYVIYSRWNENDIILILGVTVRIDHCSETGFWFVHIVDINTINKKKTKEREMWRDEHLMRFSDVIFITNEALMFEIIEWAVN